MTRVLSIHYRISEFLDTGNPYGVKLEPYLDGPVPIGNAASYAAVENYRHDFLCNGDVRTEEMRMRFPPTVKLLAVPHDVDVVQPDMSYSARYEQHDNELRVVRTLTDNSPGPVCGAAVVAQYRAIAEAVKKDMQVQAVYQPR